MTGAQGLKAPVSKPPLLTRFVGEADAVVLVVIVVAVVLVVIVVVVAGAVAVARQLQALDRRAGPHVANGDGAAVALR